MSKKLLFITTRLFWPTDSGRKVSLYYYCKGLHDKYGYDIYIYSFLEHGQTEDLLKDKPDFIKEVRLASSVDKVSKVKNLLFKSIFTLTWPLQCSLFYSKKNHDMIAGYANQINPEVIIVDMVRLAPYYDALKELNCKKIIDMDDMLSKRYTRQIGGNTKTSIAGQYGTGMSGFLNSIIGLSFIKNSILRFESKLMEKAEIKYGQMYDSVVFVSQKECDELNSKIGCKSVAVPMGVYRNAFENCRYQPTEGNELCFVGNMAVAANADTLQMIVSEILPNIKSSYKLTVIGKCPKELKEQYKSNPKISFTGRVDSIYEHASNASLFLAPIAYGSGIKTKILEAMAMQLPVITNSVGAEGIDLNNEEHFVVEDNYKVIAEKVDYYLEHKEEARIIAESGQKAVFALYEWNEIWKKFEDILQ